METRALLSIFVVNTVSDLDRGGGLPLGQESLRQAIEDVNEDSNPAVDTIDFNIPGSGVQDIQPLTDLPTVTHAVLIDGYSQPGSSPNTLANGDNAVLLIELDGSLDTSGSFDASYDMNRSRGFDFSSNQSTVQGLDVNRFYYGLGAFVIQGDFIGTDPTGTQALGNVEGIPGGGVVGTNGDGVNDLTERNLISGNLEFGARIAGSASLVAGNFIGTDITGTKVLGNGIGVLLLAGRVGADGHDADPTGERNIIAGNSRGGDSFNSYGGADVYVAGPSCIVAGNYIGTDVWGEHALVNPQAYRDADIYVEGNDNRIGTDGDGVGDSFERTIISGGESQARDGIAVGYSGNVIAGNYIGTDATGTIALGNYFGISLSGATGNRIGADGRDLHPDAERNVISGNAGGVRFMNGANNNEIAGNFIGTDATGTLALGNGDGIYSDFGGDHNIIGTNSDGVGDAAERNIISGNNFDGIDFRASSGNDYNTIAGNYIGTDVSGTQPLGNGSYGFEIRGEGVGNLVGVNSHAANPAAGRNVIADNGRGGVTLFGIGGLIVSQTVIAGNYIGTDVSGEHAFGNGVGGDSLFGPFEGVSVIQATFTRIGTDGDGLNDSLEGNVIAASRDGGVGILAGANGTLVAGNRIGTDAAGSTALGNTGPGVFVDYAAMTQVGGTGDLANSIAFNSGAGVFVRDSSSGTSVERNSIYANGALGIDRGGSYSGGDGVTLNAPQGPTNFPVLSTAYAGSSSTVFGTLDSTPNANFTIDFYANAAPDASGYGQGKNYLGSTTVSTDANGNAGFTAAALGATSPGEWISATATNAGGDTSEFSQDVQAISVLTTTTLTCSASTSSFGQALTFTATVTANSGSGTPTGSVDFIDTTTGNDLGSVALSGGVASLNSTSLPLGSQTITATYGGNVPFLASSATITVSIVPSIIVLDSTAAGALTVSGNASINLPGAAFVDSSSSRALSASGNAQISASVIDVHGGVQKSGNATFSPAPITGAAPLADPLFSLASPSTSGLTFYGSKSLSGNSTATINPGIYGQISVSGNARLTMNSGTYIVEGGGLTVSGNASVSGANVFIYNAGSNYPNPGGNFGGITLSGNGTFSLSAPANGAYAGVLIFQSRQNTRALSLSGNAAAGLSGTIYAANALLSLSGNSQLQSSLVVGMLNLSGNVALTQTATGGDGTGDTSGIANTLLAGDLSVYINDPNGYFTSDELARIQDAISAWDSVLAPYNVTISEVSDPTEANMVIDTGTTSACGGAADGVLGCYDVATSEITVVQGWNWYAGADPSQIGAGQYDFETTMLHELGHALGLGGSTDPGSPMYETLAAGVADRNVTTQDLNISDAPEGADPQIAGGFHVVPAPSAFSQNGNSPSLGLGPNAIAAAKAQSIPAGVTVTAYPTGLLAQSHLLQPPELPVAGQAMITQTGRDPSFLRQAADREGERSLIPWLTPDLTDPLPALESSGHPGSSRAEPAVGSEIGHEHSFPQQPSTLALEAALDELATDSVRWRAESAASTTGVPTVGAAGVLGNPVPNERTRQQDQLRTPGGFTARLATLLLAAGFGGHAGATLTVREPIGRRVRARWRAGGYRKLSFSPGKRPSATSAT
jgi:titin